MAIKFGKCRNFGSCRLADDRVLQEAAESEFVCGNPDCRSVLVESRAKPVPGPGPGRSLRVVRGTLAALAAGLAGMLLSGMPEGKPSGEAIPARDASASSPRAAEPRKTMEQWAADFNIDR